MKVTDARWLDRLAAEYVLGTLRGAARRRFERELGDARVSAALFAWEDRLAPLVAQLQRAEPDPATWPAIQRRLGLAARSLRTRRPGWRRAGVALAAVLSMVAVGVSVRIWQETHQFRPAAMVASSDGQPLWQVDLSGARDELRVTAIGTVQIPPDQDFELWALPDNASPVSLGLLPASGRVERGLSLEQRSALAVAHKVAVSLEPRGGSRTGGPTGPIVHVVPVRVANIRGLPAAPPS